MKPPYAPLSGTTPARVIAHLQSLPVGDWIASAPLAEAVGTDRNSLSAFMKAAVDHGLVVSERRADGLNYWQVGAEQITVADQVEEMVQAVIAAKAPALKIPKFIASKAMAETAPMPGPEVRQLVKAAPKPFRAALWSDGQLVIEKGGVDLALTVDETRALMGYLDRMAVAE